jgi:hypothetical protein
MLPTRPPLSSVAWLVPERVVALAEEALDYWIFTPNLLISGLNPLDTKEHGFVA